MSRDPFDTWYSTQAIAARFVTGLDATVAERSIRREIERVPALKAAVKRRFGHLFLPWAVLKPWLEESAPAKVMPSPGVILLDPIVARSEGELTRKAARLCSVQTPGQSGKETVSYG